MGDRAADEARKATITPEEWAKRIRAQPGYAYKKTAWWKVLKAAQAEAAEPKPLPQPPPGSVFCGKGAFATTDPAACRNRGCDWVAYQMDPEGTPTAAWDPGSRACYWMARPSQEVADKAARLGVPFIAQAESQRELDRALALDVQRPKALIGNPHAWTDPVSVRHAAAEGWELILEWYMNAQPWQTEPDAANYPLFVNVCYGIYSEGEPGQAGHVAQIPLADYARVWHGSFSVWKAEAMTEADWALYRTL